MFAQWQTMILWQCAPPIQRLEAMANEMEPTRQTAGSAVLTIQRLRSGYSFISIFIPIVACPSLC